MSQLFEQLGFISAILAGFAFTFVASLLTLRVTSRMYTWAFSGALLASFSLMLGSVAAVLASLGVASNHLDEQRTMTLLAVVSQSFLVGIFALVLAFGCSGWLHSRRVGQIATILSVLTAVTLVAIIVPFLRLA